MCSKQGREVVHGLFLSRAPSRVGRAEVFVLLVGLADAVIYLLVLVANPVASTIKNPLAAAIVL